MSRRLLLFLFSIPLVLAGISVSAPAAEGENPCAEKHARALVLGGGGSKGAFQAGAAYHLIAHRGCDFVEISGTSAGALNGAILAQAEAAPDAERSLQQLQSQAQSLVDLWLSIKGNQDVMRSRPLAMLRFGIFGLESMKDFGRLRKLLADRVALERLETGREFRVGTISIFDGRYREVVINPRGKADPATAHDFIFGSGMVPVFGTMPRIAENGAPPQQFADGGLRHSTPVNSYFITCDIVRSNGACVPLPNDKTPPHGRLEQLFIILTTPYERQTDARPVVNPKAVKPGTRQISDGRLLMARALDLLTDTIYRDDLDDMLLDNDLLRWRAQAGPAAEAMRFPLESYNSDPDRPAGATRPYEVAVVMPAREDTDPTTMFDVRPATIRRQLYCGCRAADDMMRHDFSLPSLAAQCAEKFPPLPDPKKASSSPWKDDVCRDAQSAPPAVASVQ